MKLSDFGLCKPLDCSNLSPIQENEVLDDENLNDTKDLERYYPDMKSGRCWESPLEQLKHWQMNRRKLVGEGLPLSLLLKWLQSSFSYFYSTDEELIFRFCGNNFLSIVLQ